MRYSIWHVRMLAGYALPIYLISGIFGAAAFGKDNVQGNILQNQIASPKVQATFNIITGSAFRLHAEPSSQPLKPLVSLFPFPMTSWLLGALVRIMLVTLRPVAPSKRSNSHCPDIRGSACLLSGILMTSAFRQTYCKSFNFSSQSHQPATAQ